METRRALWLLLSSLLAVSGCASEQANDEPSLANFPADEQSQMASTPGVFLLHENRIVTATLADRILRRRTAGVADDAQSANPNDMGRLEVSLGRSYAEGARVGISWKPRAWAEFVPIGASEAKARVRGDGALVAYEGAYPEVTAVFSGSTRRMKEWLQVPDASKLPELRYEVRKGPEFGKFVTGEAGELWAYDAEGGPLFAVPRPLAKDAANQVINGSWELIERDGSTVVRASIDLQRAAYPILIDPSFDTPTWFADGSTPPPARAAAASAWHYNLQMAVMFGGLNNSGYLGDTRVHITSGTGSQWRNANISASSPAKPSGRAYAAMASRDNEGIIYLFGGHTSSRPVDDMWSLLVSVNGTNITGTWTRVPEPSPKTTTNWPSRRMMHGMAALDPDTILMFGGVAPSGELLKDTWQWNGTSWTRLCTDCFPGLYGFSTVPGRTRVAPRDNPAVFGGYAETGMSNAVYRWNGSNAWEQVSVAEAIIPTNDDGTVSWTPSEGTLSPRNRYMGFGMWTPNGSIVVGGGLDVSNTGTETYFNDLWQWTKPGQPGGDRWVRQSSVLSNLSTPGIRESPVAMLFETEPSGSVPAFGLLFGGLDSSGNVVQRTRLLRSFSDSVTMTVRTTSAGNYALLASVDLEGVDDETRIAGYFVRRVTTPQGPRWETVAGCGSPSGPLVGSPGMVLGCSTAIASNTATTAFGVLVRDHVYYTLPSNQNGTDCRNNINQEARALCGLRASYPGQSSCGLTGVSGTPSCPAPLDVQNWLDYHSARMSRRSDGGPSGRHRSCTGEGEAGMNGYSHEATLRLTLSSQEEVRARMATNTNVPPSQSRVPFAPPSLPIPAKIDGVYRVERPLGGGSMGKVVLALDERLERQVAIKFIRPEHVGSAEAHARFVQEARAMARVRDPHVVEIHALGEVEGVPYLVMEYVPGNTLEARLGERRGEPLPLDEALDLMDQICRGVEAIHASGAVHRDLKPSNILLGPGGRVAVADLGLAKLMTGQGTSEASEVAGTPAYISPEVIASRPLPASLAARADIYALGVMAYQLFTGRLPFEERDVQALLDRHLNSSPLPLRRVRPELPARLETVVLDALHKDPEARMPSAEALRRSLQEARESTPIAYRGVRVLVVDDDTTCARLVGSALAAGLPGATVDTACDGEQALQTIDARLPSLVVADLQMPRLNGFELLASLRGNDRTRAVPVVMMTATGSGRDWKLMQQLGAEGFLIKPLDIEQLLTVVRSVLSRTRPAHRKV